MRARSRGCGELQADQGREVTCDVDWGKRRSVRRRTAAVLTPTRCVCFSYESSSRFRGHSVCQAVCGALDEGGKNRGTLICERAKWTVSVSLHREPVATAPAWKGRSLCPDYRTDCINQPDCFKMASAISIAASIASKTKTKKKHFVAQKVKLFRASDPLLSVVMWGVNHSVSHLIRILRFTAMSPFIPFFVMCHMKR